MRNLLPKLAALVLSAAFFTLTVHAQSDGLSLIEKQLSSGKSGKIDPQVVRSITVTKDYVDHGTGIRHIYAAQKLNGITIPNGAYSLHTKGAFTFDASNLVDVAALKIAPVTVNITPENAAQIALAKVNYSEARTLTLKKAPTGADMVTVFSRNTSPIWDMPCRLIYHQDKKTDALIVSWEVQFMDVFKRHYWQITVDANTGKVLDQKDLITHCSFGDPHETDLHARDHSAAASIEKQNVSASTAPLNRVINGIVNSYRVFPEPYESPEDPGVAHSIMMTGGTPSASFDGWHKVANAAAYQYTRGNNVWAFQDPSPGPLGGVPSADPTRTTYNNGGPLGTPVATEPFLFDYAANLTQDPTAYQNAAIVNLFYWNNLIHDVFYQFGFDEVGGNFEDSHTFSNGTKGSPTDNAGDAVLAQAQDGGGTNNANMLTLQDGVAPQMQMYLWTGSVPDSMVKIVTSSTGVPPNDKRYFAQQGSFAGPASNPNLYTSPVVNKPFVIVQKNALSTVGSSSEGCSTGQQGVALPPANDVTNKIVLIDRGNCSFVEKVFGAQNGGAAGVIVINNTPGEPIVMGGSDATGNAITIPAVMVSQDVGTFLKAQITGGATINGSLQRQNPTPARRDGDFDNAVISHEYGHGISSRLTGGPDGGSLGGDEQGGEGWSDFIGLYMTLRQNDMQAPAAGHPNGVLPTRSIGNYVTYQANTGRGIRPFPYSIDLNVNPVTFQNINDGGEFTVPHGVGSIWATMLYDVLQEMIDLYPMNDDVYNAANPVANAVPPGAGGNNVAMRLVIEGMKLQANSPTFVQMRDGILKADTLLYNATHACRLWRAFAKRGLGIGAVSGTNSLNDELESYNVPLSCNAAQTDLTIEKTGAVLVDNNQNISYTIKVTNNYATPVLGVSLRDTLASTLGYLSAAPVPTSVSGQNLEWVFDLAANETKTFTINVSVASASASSVLFQTSHETGSQFTASSGPGFVLGPWTLTTNAANAFSGTKYWFSSNAGVGGQDSRLTKTTAVVLPANAFLVFIHKYSTESSYDGGWVETSTDNGLTWTQIPAAKFVRGGYTGVIPTENTPQVGAAAVAAFTGGSPGYITSIAKLDNFTAGTNLLFRFRMVADPTGGTALGWFIDDVLILSNPVEVQNSATVRSQAGEPIRDTRGPNAKSVTNAFIIQTGVVATGLGRLNATLVSGKVKLTWNNANDANTQVYVVERKAANDADFLPIANVAARRVAGTQDYMVYDANVKGNEKYEYRIRAEFSAGSKQFTNIASVRTDEKGFSLVLYPNPASDNVNIAIYNPAGTAVTYRLYDILGKSLGTFKAGAGNTINVKMPLTSLSAGSYWIEADNGEGTAITRLIVTK